MSIHVNNTGTYVPAKKIFVRQSDVWEQVKRIYVREAGVWELAYINEYNIIITSNVQNPDVTALLTAQGWDGTSPISVSMVINTDSYIGSTSTAVASLIVPALPVGSSFNLVNNGYILGKGGNGGAGGSNGGAGGVGGVGGIAIQLGMDITIDNINGLIAGGGLGGNGTNSYSVYTPAALCVAASTSYYGGNGGGGGAGWLGGARGNRGVWTSNYGAYGVGGTNFAGGSPNGGALGNGKAVNLLTNVVTWTAGNDAARVKGAVS